MPDFQSWSLPQRVFVGWNKSLSLNNSDPEARKEKGHIQGLCLSLEPQVLKDAKIQFCLRARPRVLPRLEPVSPFPAHKLS